MLVAACVMHAPPSGSPTDACIIHNMQFDMSHNAIHIMFAPY